MRGLIAIAALAMCAGAVMGSDLLRDIQGLKERTGRPVESGQDSGVMYMPSGRICPDCSQVQTEKSYTQQEPKHNFWLPLFIYGPDPVEDSLAKPDWESDRDMLCRGGNKTRLLILYGDETLLDYTALRDFRRANPGKIGQDWEYPVQAFSLKLLETRDEEKRVASAFRCQTLADGEFSISLPKAIEIYEGNIVGTHYGEMAISRLLTQMDVSCTAPVVRAAAPRGDGLAVAPDCSSGVCRAPSCPTGQCNKMVTDVPSRVMPRLAVTIPAVPQEDELTFLRRRVKELEERLAELESAKK